MYYLHLEFDLLTCVEGSSGEVGSEANSAVSLIEDFPVPSTHDGSVAHVRCGHHFLIDQNSIKTVTNVSYRIE